jgi:hypothetical protein
MAGRSEELWRQSKECAELAGKAADPSIRREFLALATHFRNLAAKVESKAVRAIMSSAAEASGFSGQKPQVKNQSSATEQEPPKEDG